MQSYIKYLLQDIKNAERNGKDNLSHSYSPSFEQEEREIERYISGEGRQTISYFTGLDKEQFPPKEQLSDSDIKLILMAFNEMFKTWNASIEYPEEMPLRERYDFLRNSVLEECFTPINIGCVHFDFCTGNPSGCAWGKYCKCSEDYNDIINKINCNK